jgi:hypothetical protein
MPTDIVAVARIAAAHLVHYVHHDNVESVVDAINLYIGTHCLNVASASCDKYASIVRNVVDRHVHATVDVADIADHMCARDELKCNSHYRCGSNFSNTEYKKLARVVAGALLESFCSSQLLTTPIDATAAAMSTMLSSNKSTLARGQQQCIAMTSRIHVQGLSLAARQHDNNRSHVVDDGTDEASLLRIWEACSKSYMKLGARCTLGFLTRCHMDSIMRALRANRCTTAELPTTASSAETLEVICAALPPGLAIEKVFRIAEVVRHAKAGNWALVQCFLRYGRYRSSDLLAYALVHGRAEVAADQVRAGVQLLPRSGLGLIGWSTACQRRLQARVRSQAYGESVVVDAVNVMVRFHDPSLVHILLANADNYVPSHYQASNNSGITLAECINRMASTLRGGL